MPPVTSTNPRKILVVDDVEESRYYLEALLRGHGHEVFPAINGAEALTLARNEMMDLIVSDVLMPVMDGFELCRRCKQDSYLAGIPFVFYTATYVNAKDQALGLSLGADYYLIKPLEPDTLMQVFQDAIGGKRQVRPNESHPSTEDDPLRLREHNEALIRKLEAKMIQLESANENLERELSERRKAEIRLQRLYTAIENAGECILIADPGGLIEYVNPAFKKTLGMVKEEVIGKRLADLTGCKRNGLFFKALRESLPSARPWKGNLSSRTKGGKRIEFAATVSPIAGSDGRASGFVATMQDLTAQRNLENQLAQAQKMEAIGTLAGGIAHDFNNILASIFGFAEISLLQVPRENRVYHYLEQILTSSRRAKELVRQILTFSRKSEQEHVPVQAGILIKETFRLLRSTLPSTVEMRQKIHPDAAGTTIIADPTQLHQVLMNLCANAAHAMRDKGGVLEIGLVNVNVGVNSLLEHQDLEQGQYLKLTVSDTGHGMDETVLPRIFDPYFTTKGPEEGTGLGLAVVYGIVKSLRGSIKVHSEQGKGTTFEIFFPRSEVAAASASDPASPLPVGKGRILIVDDEKILVEMLEAMLSQLGYQVTTSNNGADALEAFKASPAQYDLVITDQTMPKMQGTDLAREILKIRGDIPVILSTGFCETVDEEKAGNLGIRGILLKPVSWRNLAEIVQKHLA